MSASDLKQALELEGCNPLGEKCPVMPLGHSDGSYYFTDPDGQFRAFRQRAMSGDGLSDLFLGGIEWLTEAYPPKAPDRPTAPLWDKTAAVAGLIAACREQGFFDPSGAIRGVGVWPWGEGIDPDLPIILHCGDRVGVMAPGQGGRIDWRRPGCRLGNYVYSASPAVMRPAEKPLSLEQVGQLRDFIGTWNWRQPEFAMLMLCGHLAACFMPGVLPYRPTLWQRAEKGSGKSAYQKLIRRLMGSTALWYSSGTAAFLREEMGNTSRCVILDEVEAKQAAGTNRAEGLVELARYTYQQGQGGWGRGGQQAASGMTDGIFVFGAIQAPPIDPQDRSRHINLTLGPLLVDENQINDFEARLVHFGGFGPGLWRRLLNRWDDFADVLRGYRSALRALGHEVRATDTFGSMMACAELMLFDERRSEDEVLAWARKAPEPGDLNEDGQMTNSEQCWQYLRTIEHGDWGSGHHEVMGELMIEAFNGANFDVDQVRRNLRRFGIAVTNEAGKKLTPETELEDRYIAVARNHARLAKLFDNTPWARGGHAEALLGLEGAYPAIRSKSTVRFDGGVDRAVLIPYRRLMLDQGSRPPGHGRNAQAAE